MSHYYITDDTLDHTYQTIDFDMRNVRLILTTDRGVFSRNYIDYGTKILIENLDLNHVKKALDIGCGYGPVGLFIAGYDNEINVVLSDVNERAIALAKKNIEDNHISHAKALVSHVFEKINESFDLIVTNPPIRAGKDTVFSIYEGANNHLNDGGSLYVVIQKKQGAPSSVKKIETLFGNCEILVKSKGYWVLLAKKEKSS